MGRPLPIFILPAALVGVALALIGLAVAAVLLGRDLDVGQLAHAVLGMMLAAFHRAMDGLVVLRVHVEYPHRCCRLAAQYSFCPDMDL